MVSGKESFYQVSVSFPGGQMLHSFHCRLPFCQGCQKYYSQNFSLTKMDCVFHYNKNSHPDALQHRPMQWGLQGR